MFQIYDYSKINVMLICIAVQLGNTGLVVDSTCGAQMPITTCEGVTVKMSTGLNIVCQIL